MKRLDTIFFKFFLSNLFIIFLFSCFFIAFSIKSAEKVYVKQIKEDLSKISIALYNTFKSFLINKKFREIDELCKTYGKRAGIRVTIIKADGCVVGDSYKDPKKMENHINRPEIQEALKKAYGSSIRYSTTLNRYLLYYAIPIKDGKKTIGFLRVSLFLEKMELFLNRAKHNMINLVIILSVCTSFVALILSRSLTKPIEEMVKGVSEIAKGNFQVRLSHSAKGELSYLSSHINKMAEQLEWLFEELEKEKEELEAIIEGIQAGLVVINKEGIILRANKNFKDIIQKDKIENRLYWEVLREPEFNKFFNQLKESAKNRIKELSIKGKPYLCSATFIEKNENIIVIFHDITPIKEMERLKKDLVTSVSHELKTPHTAIKGYVETLSEDIKDEEKKYYFAIINRNIDRLSNIINDLLLLNFLETKKELYLEKVDLEKLIKNILELFREKIKQKRLDLKIEIDPDARYIWADEFRLEQAILNLVDNAIKYTEEGYVAIKLCSEGSDKIAIVIKDTGIGIPEEHIPYIFERFYVVNKSRSRKTGGTGLGLSIVKHIVQLHKGDIRVKSSVGKGSCFTIIIPKNLQHYLLNPQPSLAPL